jgi:DNA-binding response OmpR family regulator
MLLAMGKKILVVEDDNLLLEALDNLLMHEHFLTRTVVRAEEVESEVLDFLPDLIIMDIRLDSGDGRIICDKIKSEIATSHIPIVLLTGLSYDEIALIDCKADAIIGKPYDNTSLLRTIDQCLKTG